MYKHVHRGEIRNAISITFTTDVLSLAYWYNPSWWSQVATLILSTQAIIITNKGHSTIESYLKTYKTYPGVILLTHTIFYNFAILQVTLSTDQRN